MAPVAMGDRYREWPALLQHRRSLRPPAGRPSTSAAIQTYEPIPPGMDQQPWGCVRSRSSWELSHASANGFGVTKSVSFGLHALSSPDSRHLLHRPRGPARSSVSDLPQAAERVPHTPCFRSSSCRALRGVTAQALPLAFAEVESEVNRLRFLGSLRSTMACTRVGRAPAPAQGT
jgi:hypothetical protein